MYAITGITGKVGGALARTLLAGAQPVRAVLRDAAKGRLRAEQGCEVALAEKEDATALTAAFSGAEGVFIRPPSEFDPAPDFPEARAVITAVRAALDASSSCTRGSAGMATPPARRRASITPGSAQRRSERQPPDQTTPGDTYPWDIRQSGLSQAPRYTENARGSRRARKGGPAVTPNR
jgi:hypothetical protein